MAEKQKMRYSDAELSLIKNTFSGDNEDLIKLTRKIFLQDVLSKDEIKRFAHITKSQPVLDVITKSFKPEVELDAPLHQVVDLWMTVDFKGKSLEDSVVAMKVRANLIEYSSLGLQRLAKPTEKGLIELLKYAPDFDKTDEELYIEINSRTSFVAHIESQLQQLTLLAGKKEETVEETIERLRKNSTK